MIRNMPYRAKHNNSNEWIYGYYAAKKSTTYCFESDYHNFPVETEHYIIQERMTDWSLPNEFRLYRVNGDTVCRNTGCVDQDSNPIFENDIAFKVVETFAEDANGNKLKCFRKNICGVVKYKNGAFGVETEENGSGQFLCFFEDCCKVIGNIYDNPELVEKLNERTTDKETTKDA